MSRTHALCIMDSTVNFSCFQRSLSLKLDIRVMTEKDVFDCVYRRHVEILTLNATCRLIADVRVAHKLYFVLLFIAPLPLSGYVMLTFSMIMRPNNAEEMRSCLKEIISISYSH